jgi:hypothetical protein
LALLHWEKSGLIGGKSELAHKSRATWKLVLCARYNRAFSHGLGGKLGSPPNTAATATRPPIRMAADAFMPEVRFLMRA